MTTRDTIEGILTQWAEAHGGAPETPQALLDAYRAEVLNQAADALVEAIKSNPACTPDLHKGVYESAGELCRMATEIGASPDRTAMS